jgi:UDP:flavonoid glycosyltransferase YjiC (YdhE family)
MLVHHGGIGSSAQAIRAGIPQIVLPDRFDQPDNALRVAILGLGGAVFSPRPPAAALAELIRNVLQSETVRRQLAIGAALVRNQPSRDTAYRLIQDVIERRFGRQMRADLPPIRAAV